MVDLESWRAEVRTWLEATLPRRQAEDPDAPSEPRVDKVPFKDLPRN